MDDSIELRVALASGRLRASGLAERLIARIAGAEPQIGAFAWFNADALRDAAARADRHLADGGVPGQLHGLPIGIKDSIDTADIPTENGSAADKGRVPGRDAACVARLRAAGGLILGKTVTTELQFLHPSATRNPVDPAHTPGGSSAGSAAAVAAGMAPLAIGTQTGGSVIRPAAFCGCVGFKPGFGAIPTDGVLVQAPSLDTVGVFAPDVAGAALLAQVLAGWDGAVPHAARPARIGLLRMPAQDRADPVMIEGLAGIADRLGACAVELPPDFDAAADLRARINDAEMAWHYRRYAEGHWDALSAPLRDAITRGRAVSAPGYLAALQAQADFTAGLEALFSRADLLIAPAAPGPAPRGLESTGDSIFNGLFTMTGHPAITLPLLRDGAGMPMGVQLIGRRGGDAALLAHARWVEAARRGPADQNGISSS